MNAPASRANIPLKEAKAKNILEGNVKKGIALCGTGIGISISANRFKGIRAALSNNKEIAFGARKWNDANILTMGILSVKEEEVEDIITSWIDTKVDSSEMKNIKSISEIEL